MAGQKIHITGINPWSKNLPRTGSKNLKPLFLCWFFLERKSFLYSKTLEPKIFSYSEKIKKTGTWFSNSEKEQKKGTPSFFYFLKLKKTRSRGS
jgi:hypothetical protein